MQEHAFLILAYYTKLHILTFSFYTSLQILHLQPVHLLRRKHSVRFLDPSHKSIVKVDQKVLGSVAPFRLGAPLPPALFTHGLAALGIRHFLAAIVKRSATGPFPVI